MAMTAIHSATKAALRSYAQLLRFKLRNTSVRTELLRGQAGPHEAAFVHSFNEDLEKVPA